MAKHIQNLQQLTDRYSSGVCALWEDHKKLLEEKFNAGFFSRYVQRDHPRGWSAFRIYEEIKHIDFPSPQHLLDKMSDLEVEQGKCDLENDLAPDAPPLASLLIPLKRKTLQKGTYLNLLMVRKKASRNVYFKVKKSLCFFTTCDQNKLL